MGAISFKVTAYGKDIADAYNRAVEDAEDYYGRDRYNGTISTTYGFREVRSVVSGEKWTKTKEKKAYEYAYKELDTMDSRECKGIDLGKVSRNVSHHNGWHKFLFFGWAAE